MRYQSLSVLVIVIAVLFIAIDSSRFLQNGIMAISDGIKTFVLDTKDSISLSYQKYLNQAASIEEYKQKLKDYEKLKLQLLHTQSELDGLSVFDTQQAFHNDARFLPARVYSYVGMGDYNRVWINFDAKGYPKDRIFGVVRDSKVLGIALIDGQKVMGFFNGDKKSAYSVHIGDSKIPAIVHNSAISANRITADFIPLWHDVNVGDQVRTSGLDGIFVEGILVGEVASVNKDFGYISAEIKPYAQSSSLGYVWLVDTQVEQQIAEEKSPF